MHSYLDLASVNVAVIRINIFEFYCAYHSWGFDIGKCFTILVHDSKKLFINLYAIIQFSQDKESSKPKLQIIS